MKFLSRLGAIIAFVLNRPFKVRLHRGDAWFYPAEGRVLPVIAGADGDGDGNGDGDGQGAADGDGSGDGDDTGDASGDDSGDGEGEGSGDGEGEGKKEDWKVWKAESRKHERRSKKEKEAREATEAKLKEREDADKSEQEKAVEKAREEGKAEALTVAEKERRKDRLESAVTRAAGKKIQIGDGEDKKTVRFDDPEDAELYLRAKISKGDLDEDDLFDSDGKIKADAVAGALKEILEEKPRLAEADATEPLPKKKTADGGANGGEGEEKKALDELSVEEHIKRQAKGKAA